MVDLFSVGLCVLKQGKTDFTCLILVGAPDILGEHVCVRSCDLTSDFRLVLAQDKIFGCIRGSRTVGTMVSFLNI